MTATWSDIETLAARAARRGLVQVVRMTTTVSAAAPWSLDVRVASTTFPIGAATLEEWSRATTELLASLL